MMTKAYILSGAYESDQGVTLVWASTAKQALIAWDSDIECDYIDRRCRRAPEFDHMENAPYKEIMYIQWQLGWSWDYLITPPPECDYNTPRTVFDDWYNNIYSPNQWITPT